MTEGGGIEEERKVCVVGVLGIWVFGEWWKERMGSGLWFKQEEEHGSLGMWVVGDGQGRRRSGEEEVMGVWFLGKWGFDWEEEEGMVVCAKKERKMK